MYFDIYGNAVDPTSYTGQTYDANGNAVDTIGQSMAASNAAATNYGATYAALTTPAGVTATAAPASSGAGTWIQSIVGGASTLANSAASVYNAVSGGGKATGPTTTTKSVNGVPVTTVTTGSGFSTNTSILAVVGILIAVLVAMRFGKK